MSFLSWVKRAAAAATLPAVLFAAPAFAQTTFFTVSDDIVAPGDTVSFTFIAGNTLAQRTSDGSFSVDMNGELPGFTGFSITANTCSATLTEGAVLTFSPITSFFGCQITFEGTVPALAADATYTFAPTNYTGTYDVGGTYDVAVPTVDLQVSSADIIDPTTTIEGPTSVDGPFTASVSFTTGGAGGDPDFVTGLEVSDFSVTNATLDSVTGTSAEGDNWRYLLALTPTGAGTPITVDLPADSATDLAGNGNLVSNTYSVAYAAPVLDDVTFTAEFIDDPIAGGQSATLRFTITNANATHAATAAAFSFDVDATMSGATASSLPAGGFCGASSSMIDIGGGAFPFASSLEIAASDSCTFDLVINTPALADPSQNDFTTSVLSYTMDGDALTADAASANLELANGEGTGSLDFSKEFTDDPVEPGGTVTLEYTISADDGGAGGFTTTGIAFTDNIDGIDSGMVATGLPATDVCGVGSTLSGTSTVSLTGGSLANNGSCTFSVTLSVPGGTTAGNYGSTTGTLSATRSDFGAVSISGANDTLVVQDEVVEDGAGPATTISGDSGDVGAGEVFTVTIRFGEDVTGFVIGDIVVTNGASSNFQTVSAAEYTVDITPAVAGSPVEVDVAAGVAIDGDSDPNDEAETFSRDVVTAAPEIAVSGNGTDITDGDTTPAVGDDTYYGDVLVGGPGTSQTFTVENTGTSVLTISSVVLSGTHSSDFSVTTDPTGSIAAGGSASLTVSLVPSASGLREATVTINSDDADEAAFDFAISGTGASVPEINVTDASETIDILDGDGTPTIAKGSDFGSLAVASGTASATFVIQNVGAADLTLGATPVTISGSGDFTVTSQPTGPISAASGSSFTITFDPSSVATSNATVSIESDDSDENPYTFAITGVGTDDVAPSGYTVAFDAAGYGTTAVSNASFTIDDPEVGADFTYSISSSGGGTAVAGSGTIPIPDAGTPSEYQIAGLDLSGLNDGTLTVTVSLTDPAGNAGSDVTGTAALDRVGPTPALTTVSSDPVSGAFTLDIDFGETVSGFVLGDLSVGNGAASGFSDDGAGAFSATITPASDGSVTIDIAAAAATDSLGNDSLAATQFTIENDETGPTVAITTGSSDPVSGAFTATFTFSESVTGFVVGDISVGNGAASGFAGSGDTYTATITPAADGSVTVDVAAAAAQDAAGNDNTAATQFTIENDETAPTVAITTGSSDPVSGAFTATFTFSESVTGFVVGDISVGNGAASGFAGSGDTYTATITPAADGSVTVDVAAASAQDSAGNDNTAATQFSIENDETAPTVAISTGSSDPVSGAFTATFTFSESVTGFALGDISVGNGAASGFAGSGDTYTATITPAADGSVTVDVAAAAAQDSAGNDNTAATQFSIENDETAPTVAITTGSSDPVSGAFTATFTFSESVTGFAVGDISVGNGAASGFAGSGDTYTATITPAADGSVTVDVAAASAQDAAGNDNTAATQFTIENDETAPTVAITTGSSDPVSGAFTATFSFSESVTGFVVGDISVGNGAASGFSGSGDTYTATITPAADGSVTVDVAAAAAQDAAGNDNTAATQFTIENDETAPTVAITTGSSDPVSGVFTATFTFSESVTGFVVGDISVGNGAASGFSGSGDTYTATITPAADGSVTVDVAAAAAQDSAGNDNTAATQFSIENDETGPTVAITTGSSDPVSGAFTATFTFSESVTGFVVGDISVGNGAASGFSGSGDTYTATITPASDGSVTVDVAAAVAQDAAGNDNTAATQFSIENDETGPTVSIATTSADPVSGAFGITVTFSESVTGFVVGDISVGNGSAGSFAGSGDSYTATITPAADGSVTVDVAAAAAQDAAGNDNTAAAQFSIENDETAPTVAITTGSSDPVSGAFTATFTFSESVTGFVVGDISVGNGAASGFAGSGDTYTATITPAADGSVTVDVAAASAQDAAGNDNTAATQFTIENDETAPTVAISTGSSDPVSGAFTATFTFSESVTGFVVGDISVGNGAASGFSGSGDTYTATITPAADGSVTVDVAAASAQDSAGNDNTAATQFSIENDETAPTVTIATSSADPVSGAFGITVTFSEDVTGFAVSDLTVGNGAASGFAGSGDSYTATITPAADGSVTVDVAAAAAQDAAGNDNTAATQFTIENDETPPSVAITTGSSDPVSGVFTATFTFSESVTGFVVGDISVGNGAASGFSGSGDTYTATITPAADGSVTVDVAAAVAQDSAGNDNTAATQFTIENDQTPPTVTLSSTSSDPVSGAFPLTITFSEDVTGFVLADISVGNGTASRFSGSGDTYSVEITPAADGSVTVDVAAAAAQDAAGNDNTAATQFTIENDETGPTVSIATTSADPVSGAFGITVTFSEAVTGFAVSDLTVGNGSAGSFSGSGDTYTATITPAADGSVTVDIAAGAAQDSAGNDSGAATQFSIENDETAPTVAISTGSSDPVSGAFTATFTFSESVTGFVVGDISVGNGAASGFSGSGDTYTATITPAADGSVTVDVAAAVAQDAAGNDNTAATQFSIENDETAPTVTIATTSSDPVSGAFSVSFTFSEDVTGFALGDITVGNGTASAFAGSGAAYTATITPAADGAVTVDVAAAVAQDAAGNDNTAATQLSLEADLTAPGVDSVVASDALLSVADAGSSFTLTVTFDEALDSATAPTLGFGSDDLSSTLSFVSGAFSSGDTVYTASYTILDGGSAFTDVDVVVTGAVDPAGNGLADHTEADVFSVDQRRGGITIAAAITGSTDGEFDFSGDLGSFMVTTTGQAGSELFSDLAEGSFAVTLADEDGFSLDSITCVGGTAVTDVASGTATIDLTPGDAISCEFGLIADPEIDEEDLPTVAIVLPSAIDDPADLTTTFSLTNTGGTPYAFTAATDVTWMEIDPTSGTIPASGSLEFTVTFTDEILSLAPGTYTANITITETTAAPNTGKSGLASANALQTLTIPVTVTLEPREGTLTIIATTYPDVAGDATFTYESGDLPDFNGLSLTTQSGTASSPAATVLRGNYTLTQLVPEGWTTHDITCSGDLDNGSTFDLTTGTARIDLDPEESIVCTFANRRDEAWVREITMSAIRSFMAARADQILTHSPRLSRRMRDASGNASTPTSFTADVRDGRFEASMSTSLSAMRNAAKADDPQMPGDQLGMGSSVFGSGGADIWFQASYSSITDDRAGLDAVTDFGIYYLGVDIMASENVLIGALVQWDTTETVTGVLRSQVEGDGWMAGPYMVARLQENLYLDARAAWGQSDNQVNPLGLYWDDFETDRWLLEANLAGDFMVDNWRITPELGIAYFNEEQAAYVDSLGFAIPSQEITIGRVNFGPEIAYRFERAEGGYVEPFIRLNAVWDYDDAEVFNANGVLEGVGEFRADARLGLQAELSNGGQIGAEVMMQGVGESDFEANSAMVRVRLPLSMH